jgi:hypothetical protein
MPCVNKITQFINELIFNEASPAMNMSLANAKTLIKNVNRKYGYEAARLIIGDTLDVTTYASKDLIDKFYANELALEMAEASKTENEARSAEINNIDSEEDFIKRQFEQARDYEIASKLGDKYQKAFGIDYSIVTPAEAALILEPTPTPYDPSVSAFFYANRVYFIEGNFKSNTVVHEFAHPLIKAIAFQNPKLFDSLYARLTGTVTGREALNRVNERYPELEEGSDRYREEALVTAIELDAEIKLSGIKTSDTAFDKFMENLLFAIKKVIQALTKKVTLKNLSSQTTRDQLVDMMLNEDFVIQDINYQTNMFAEFSKDTDQFLKELKAVEPKQIINIINKFHTEMSFQLNELRNSPKKFKESLGKDAAANIRLIRDYVKGYKTVDEDITDDELKDLLDSLVVDEADLNVRSLAFINSLSELMLFARKIEKIFNDIKASKEYLTEEGNQKIQYFKQYMERESKFLKDVLNELDMDSSNKLSKEILSIKELMDRNIDKAKVLSFNYVKDFILANGISMQENVKKDLSDKIDLILKADGFTEDEINVFKDDLFQKLDVDNIRAISESDFNLPRKPTKFAKNIINEIKQYNNNKITEQTVDEYLRGHVRDLSLAGATFTPTGNINDLFGTFVKAMKNKISDAEVLSQQEQMKFVENLKPLLTAVNWNPNNTNQLADMLLFADEKGIIDEQGNVTSYQAYSYLDKFKNWEFAQAQLMGNLKKAKLKGDKAEIKAAMQAMRDFERDYKIRIFTDEVYKVQDIWLQSNTVYDPTTKKNITISADISLEAFNERKAALDDLATYSNSSEFTSLDDLLEFTPSAEAKVKYNNLYNLYDADGNYKQGVELQKVLVRRFYRQESRKFYESNPDTKKFQNDFDHFVNSELASLGITKDDNPERYEAEIKKFLAKNTRVAYTDEYYQEKTETLAEINAINEKAKGAEISKKLASLYEQRYSITNRVTDKDGEPNGAELGNESLNRLKDIEEEIIKYNAEFDRATGLSKDEAKKLRYYEDEIIALGKASEMTDAQKAEYQSFISNKTAFGLSEQQIVYLRSRFKKLAELTYTEPTDYYITTFNAMLGDTDIELITKETADSWVNSENLRVAKEANPKFAEWFDRNHVEKEVFNEGKAVYETANIRTKAWTVSKPTNPSHYKKTTLTDPSTGLEIAVDGIPIGKYSYSTIKNEYKTGYDPKTGKVKLEVGKHIDNRGNFLPKEQPLGGPFSKYMNEKYYEMKKANSPEFKLLEAIKKQRLINQEKSPYASRLYLDYARFRINTNLEYGQSGKLASDAKDKVGAVSDALKASVTRAADDVEIGQANFDPKFLYVPTDLQGKALPKVPVAGLYKMNLNSVSKDVITSELNYMNSLDLQKVLLDTQSTANAVVDVLGDPDNALDRLDRVSSKLSRAQDKAAVFLKRDTNNKLQFAKDFIARTWYGENVSEYQQENPIISKLVRKSMGAASFAFYNLNPTSTIKNKGGMTFQKLIFTAGGKHISFASMARGQIKATKAVFEYATSGNYTTGIKSLDMQLMDAFDMSPGKTKKDAKKSHTNTAIKQLLDGAWMYSDRKLTEVQGALEIGFSLMDWQMVDQVQPDGTVKQIRYVDAFETGDDGIAKLKDGINPEWGMNYIDHVVETGETLESIAKKYNMTVEELKLKNKITKADTVEEGKSLIISRNTKFNMMKLRMASANKKLNGSMSAIDSPTAEKNLWYDVVSFSRKFATGMFLSRFQMDTSKGNFGGKVWDWDLDEATRGSYITFLQNGYQLTKSVGKYWSVMTKDEKAAFYKIMMEGMLLTLSTIAITMLFGFEGDDEDRFKKLKEREEKYGNVGWLANHMLYQIIMVQKENSTMIPLPGLGAADWLDFSSTSSIVMGPTLELYQKIFMDLAYIVTGNDKAIYKQEVGPYSWQEEGNYKLWNHLASIFGVSGKNYSPIWAIKKNEIFTNLRS